MISPFWWLAGTSSHCTCMAVALRVVDEEFWGAATGPGKGMGRRKQAITNCSLLLSVFLIGELKTTVCEPAAVPVEDLQYCWSTSLFWDWTASVPVWCSSVYNVFKYYNYDRSHADRWTSAHCLRHFHLLWGLPPSMRPMCVSYIIVVKHISILKNLYIMSFSWDNQ